MEVAASARITILGFAWEPPSSTNKPCMVRLLPPHPLPAYVGGLKASGLRTRYSSSFQCHGLGSGGAGGGNNNFFDRIAMIIKSYANVIVRYFEDPVKIIDQAVIEMNNDLVKISEATAQIEASQKQLEVKYKAAEEAADQCYKKAQLALEKGDERSARHALKLRKEFADNQQLIGSQLDQMKDLVDNLQSRTQMLQSKIDEARAKKDALIARVVSAQTAKRMRNIMNTVTGSSALAAFERMDEKVMMLEFEAEANNQFVQNDLEGKFGALEVPTFDEELDELKRELNRNLKTKAVEMSDGRSAFPATSPFRLAELELETKEHMTGEMPTGRSAFLATSPFSLTEFKIETEEHIAGAVEMPAERSAFLAISPFRLAEFKIETEEHMVSRSSPSPTHIYYETLVAHTQVGGGCENALNTALDILSNEVREEGLHQSPIEANLPASDVNLLALVPVVPNDEDGIQAHVLLEPEERESPLVVPALAYKRRKAGVYTPETEGCLSLGRNSNEADGIQEHVLLELASRKSQFDVDMVSDVTMSESYSQSSSVNSGFFLWEQISR